jgi:hypothetical protein
MASLADLRLITHPLRLSSLQRMLGSIGAPALALAVHRRRPPAGALALLLAWEWRTVHPRPAPWSHSEVFEAARSLTLLHFDPIDHTARSLDFPFAGSCDLASKLAVSTKPP